jgi:hypothetical protein
VARIAAIENRLQNWARWKAGRSISYAASNPDNAGMPRDPFADAPIPVSDCEASETDDAIDQVLSSEQRLTVYEVYMGQGNEGDRLRRLGCSKTTMHERSGAAHRVLANHFSGLAERRQTERERVEALREGWRP